MLSSVSKSPLPCDLVAEMLMVRILFTQPDLLPQTGRLSPADFFDPVVGEIFRAIAACSLAGKTVDADGIASELNPGILDEVGGTAFLKQLPSTEPLKGDIATSAAYLRDLATRRHLVSYYETLCVEGGEGSHRARGMETRESANALVFNALLLAGEHYAALRSLLYGPAALPADPQAVTKAVALTACEIVELAVYQEHAATLDQQRGDMEAAERRLERAVQFRCLVPGGEA